MSADERIVEVVRGWVQKAENDLKTAAHTPTLARDCPTNTVCFHVQQCVEARLTDYAVVARYPGEYEPIPLAEARKAVAVARRVRRVVRRLLPLRARRTTRR